MRVNSYVHLNHICKGTYVLKCTLQNPDLVLGRKGIQHLLGYTRPGSGHTDKHGLLVWKQMVWQPRPSVVRAGWACKQALGLPHSTVKNAQMRAGVKSGRPLGVHTSLPSECQREPGHGHACVRPSLGSFPAVESAAELKAQGRRSSPNREVTRTSPGSSPQAKVRRPPCQSSLSGRRTFRRRSGTGGVPQAVGERLKASVGLAEAWTPLPAAPTSLLTWPAS